MIECNKLTFGYTGEIGRVKTQSMVECRFPGDIVTLLAVNALIEPLSAEALNGEISYKGRALLTVVYEDAERNVCRTERGMEFMHSAADESCAPACTPVVRLSAENISSRREGSGLYIAVVVGADISLLAAKSYDYVAGGENLVVKSAEKEAIVPFFSSGFVEADDEFDTEYVGDILMHSERAKVTSAESEEGAISVSGEINLSVCALKGENELISYERLVPFQAEIPCEGAAAGMKCRADVYMKRAEINADTDEEKGKCRVRADFTLGVNGTAYERRAFTVAEDAYSLTNRTQLRRERFEEEYLADTVKFTERVSGTAFLEGKIDYSDALCCVLLPNAEAEIVTGESESAEGAVTAQLILKASDGAHRSGRISLPFSVPLKLNASGRKEADVMACGLSVRQRKEGEIEAEAALRFNVKIYRSLQTEYLADIEEKEAIEKKKSAFSVYMPEGGSSLWDVAKRLNQTPEEVASSNPDLKFPLKEGERIVVYRKK